MLPFFLTLLIVFLYTASLTSCGYFVLSYAQILNEKFDNYFALGLSFFVGAPLFLAAWVLLSRLSGSASLALLFSTVLAASTGVLGLKLMRKKEGLKRSAALGLALLIILLSLSILKSLIPLAIPLDKATVNPFAGFGAVVHSFRAENLTNYIVTHDRLPLIAQHSGQSLFASIPLFLGVNTPQLALVFWLSIFIGMLALLSYGFSRSFTKNRILALLPALFVLLGNTALSFTYISVSDTESSLLLSSNYDTLFSVATFFVANVLLWRYLQEDPKSRRRIFILFFLAISGFIWNITGSQMILLLPFSFLAIVFVFRNTMRATVSTLALPFGIFIFAAVLGMFSIGGMLAPKYIAKDVSIPGLLSSRPEGQAPLKFRLPRTGEHDPRTITLLTSGCPVTIQTKEMPPQMQSSETPSSNTSVLRIIAKIVRSIQIVFFPLLALLISLFLLLKNKIEKEHLLTYRLLATSASILFFVGWVISSIFIAYGYTWELSKFLYTGTFLAMLLLGISLVIVLEKKLYSEIISSRQIGIIICFIILGPTLQYLGVDIIKNSVCSARPPLPTLQSRLNQLIMTNGTYGNTANMQTQIK